MDGLHLFRSHLDRAWGCAGPTSTTRHRTSWTAESRTTSRQTQIGVSREDCVHESGLVGLNRLEHGWVFLLGSLQELGVEVGVLTHALRDRGELL